jgi:hypothetical protein
MSSATDAGDTECIVAILLSFFGDWIGDCCPRGCASRMRNDTSL